MATVSACSEPIKWMGDYGCSPEEGYQLCTQVGCLYVGNMVDAVYSLVASIEKKYLTRV